MMGFRVFLVGILPVSYPHSFLHLKLMLMTTVSWAGMFYLTLYLCSKFAVTIPYLLPYQYSTDGTVSAYGSAVPEDETPKANYQTSLRKQAAAPPTWTIILPLIPVSIATYIASTRYSDFRHHGFDIIFGSLMGITLSWISFRLYHLPIRRGAGWSWGPRSAERAWGIGVGVPGYAGSELGSKRSDIEAGNHSANGSGSKSSSQMAGAESAS